MLDSGQLCHEAKSWILLKRLWQPLGKEQNAFQSSNILCEHCFLSRVSKQSGQKDRQGVHSSVQSTANTRKDQETPLAFK